MLQIRPNCELCDCDLPPAAVNARICTYECTFCVECVDNVLKNVCPNCGGGFAPRPIRPAVARRKGVSLVYQPPSPERIHTKHSREEIAAFAKEHKEISPEQR